MTPIKYILIISIISILVHDNARGDDRSVVFARRMSDFQQAYERSTPREAIDIIDDAIKYIESQSSDHEIESFVMFSEIVAHVRKYNIYTKFLKEDKMANAERKEAIKLITAAVASGSILIKMNKAQTDAERFDALYAYVNILDKTVIHKWGSQR